MKNDDIAVATKAVRDLVDQAGYGTYVSDDLCRQVATAVIKALNNPKRKKT